ncbi:MAG TPA: histidine--tRNA ligase [Chitinophagales bacterium]|nr:histidine--tRNA ligase [Chitinophagales bacterium]
MKIQARIFKGTRDFFPEQMLHRERILQVMRATFKKYGFAPLETPAIEYLDVLTGKYGEDADRLIYKLNYKVGQKDEAALHYDLTVPFSRAVAMQTDLPLPFKRYQMQPVWRADRPQPHQGRFREFYQCDADCVGSESMIIDAEMIAITYEILSQLNIPDFIIKINNRKILNGITQFIGLDNSHLADVCNAIDKLDKVEWIEVEKELIEKSISATSIEKLHQLLIKNLSLDLLKTELNSIDIAQQGIAELQELFSYLAIFNIPETHYKFDISLARGLDYYTGPIFETKLPKHPHMGSLNGGGRYNGLIASFGGKDIPAVGTSLGLDRIFTAMQQLNLLDDVKTSTKVLVGNFGEATLAASLKLVTDLRANNINTEFYPDADKLKKQFGYCDKKKIPFMCIIGEEEMTANVITLKNLQNSEQTKLSLTDLIVQLK